MLEVCQRHRLRIDGIQGLCYHGSWDVDGSVKLQGVIRGLSKHGCQKHMFVIVFVPLADSLSRSLYK